MASAATDECGKEWSCAGGRWTGDFDFYSILYFLFEVVFAVGGDTDTTEWLDTEAGM